MSIDLNQEIEIRPGSQKKRYISLGYKINSAFDVIKVKLKDIPHNSEKRVKYTCDICGNTIETNYQSYNNSNKVHSIDTCKKCYGYKIGITNRKDYNSVAKYFKDQGCTLLSTDYSNERHKLEYIASCGHINTMSFVVFKRGNGRVCKQCSLEDQHSKQRYSIEEVRDMFTKEGCKLISEEYISNDQKLIYSCSCGETSVTTLSLFLSGRRLCCGYKKISGENNHLYNPCLTEEEREAKRLFYEYAPWRKKVFEKDNYTCQCCGKQGVSLNAHHINNYKDFPELRSEITNGITLCQDSCHNAFHQIYGKRNNTHEQINEFIEMNQCYRIDNQETKGA